MAPTHGPSPTDLFDRAPCALLLTEPDGTIRCANRGSVDWLGYPHHELTGGMRLQDLLSIGGGVLYQTHCQPLLRLQKAVGDVQIDLVRRDGIRVPALLNVARHRFGEAEMDVLAIFTAIDRRAFERELQRTKAELLAAQAAREEMTGELRKALDALAAADHRHDEFLLAFCHDLRNPLGPMRGALDMLKLTIPADHAAARLIAVLDRQLRLLADLVDGASR
ncbi:histidine kinase dimerization/phospho-acceptor domain-containing protein [Pseudoduganella umbonata]|uniref:histidine kinase n=1 Tax=Pseudoduganella umbonata TaxID=864828 RepID=A0A4P8HPC2_9BURK|nr:histidine kinase dimerization/phospho-acceptor domain-containing protein [Pseudoduganella umbonata]MBB3221121.1 signal transduction histidine kinase [Pseudoduganella umbonata]QCP10314.1 hypothetical protein FCL38_07650 [Pseudoduganella umbonata]